MNGNQSNIPLDIINAYCNEKVGGSADSSTSSIATQGPLSSGNDRSYNAVSKTDRISVDKSLLPPKKRKLTSAFSPVQSPEKRKTGRPPKRGPGRPRKTPLLEAPDVEPCEEESDENEWECDDDEPPPPPLLDPEHSLDGSDHPTAPTTVHWDPQSVDGKKIGWKIHVALDNNKWVDGRIVRYDPHSHKHKIRLQHDGREHNVWIWIRNDQHSVHLVTRMVWALVKGYAWWPAMVRETNSYDPVQPLQVEFFGTGETSALRDSPDSIRPFSPHQLDPLVAKHDKKRDDRAYELACEEYDNVRKTRNEAALFYAKTSLHLCDKKAPMQIIGKRVQIFLPGGDIAVGQVRKYSGLQKKYLVAFEMSGDPDNQCEASWLTLNTRNARVLGTHSPYAEVAPEALVPFLVGYQAVESDSYFKLLNNHCRGCVGTWKKTDMLRIICDHCDAPYHLGCFDPPLQQEQYQQLIKDGVPLLCPQCTMCRGCYQKDSTFGSHPLSPLPENLSFPANETLNVCLPCREAYEDERYCPNCAHTFNDDRYNEVLERHEWYSSRRGRKVKTELVEDTEFPLVMGTFSGDDKIPHGLKVHPSLYYPETCEFGMAESDMLGCDSCGAWVHASCAGGDHMFAKEFLCRICCRERCLDIIEALKEEDRTELFSRPVIESDAPDHNPNYGPIDLNIMTERAEKDEYLSYVWTREMFELMVMNALTSTQLDTAAWNEAKQFYQSCLRNVFRKLAKAAPPGPHEKDVQKLLHDDKETKGEGIRKEDLIVDEVVPVVAIDAPSFPSVSSKTGRPRGRPRKTPLVTETFPAQIAAGDSEEEADSTPCHSPKAVVSSNPRKTNSTGKNSNDRKHVNPIPPQPQLIETTRAVTGSVLLEQPTPPYNQNVVGRMIWFRRKRDKLSWFRGKIEKCEETKSHEAGEDGSMSTKEVVIHVVKCVDAEETFHRLRLQQKEESGNLLWM